MATVIKPAPDQTCDCTKNFPSTELYWTNDGPPWMAIRAPKGYTPGDLVTDAPIGTIARCDHCNSWWVVQRDPDIRNSRMWARGEVYWRLVNMNPWAIGDRKLRKHLNQISATLDQ